MSLPPNSTRFQVAPASVLRHTPLLYVPAKTVRERRGVERERADRLAAEFRCDGGPGCAAIARLQDPAGVRARVERAAGGVERERPHRAGRRPEGCPAVRRRGRRRVWRPAAVVSCAASRANTQRRSVVAIPRESKARSRERAWRGIRRGNSRQDNAERPSAHRAARTSRQTADADWPPAHRA